MIKCYIWGTGFWANKCIKELLPSVEVLGFVESHPRSDNFAKKKVISGEELIGKEYDYIIMANSHETEIVNEFSLDENKVVYFRWAYVDKDEMGITQLRRKNSEFLKEQLFESQRKLDFMEKARSLMPCIAIETDGIAFLFDKKDYLISNEMIAYGETYSKSGMEFFYNTAPKKNMGYFLDIGANVGTTAIYFKKKLLRDLKYICFEPVKENCKFLKMNCILNDCEDIKVVNVGLSNANVRMNMRISEGAYGCCMVSDVGDTTCEFMRLDDYTEKNNLSPDDISYIWVDVETHELEVIEGGMETLRKSPASLFVELNLIHNSGNDRVKHFYEMVSNIYSKFMVCEQYESGQIEVYAIQELVNVVATINLEICNILFMK